MGKAADTLEKLRQEKERIAFLNESLRKKSKGNYKVAGQSQPSEMPKSPDLNAQNSKLSHKKEAPKNKHQTKHKPRKERRTVYEQRKFLANIVKKSGLDVTFGSLNRKVLIFTATPIIVLTFYVLVDSMLKGAFISDVVPMLLSLWFLGGLGLYLLCWLALFFYVDMRIYRRRKEIEAVFPDYLQLTAANISAGMPIDRALWFAIRPKFGILAKEMETVAKATMVGESLPKALLDFADKYDSLVVKRAMNLLIVGLDSGGEIGDLLTRISDNMRETEMIKKEMASSVTTYVIFILFATLGAAPFLFGLTTQLIVIMKSILADIQQGGGGQSFGGIGGMMTLSGGTISLGEYQIFAVVSICISCTFAAIITSIIQKGSAKEAFKKVPLYITLGLVIYFIAFRALNLFLGGFFK